MDPFYFVKSIGTAASASSLAVTTRASVVGTRRRAHRFFAGRV
jgi:hypothetical protein